MRSEIEAKHKVELEEVQREAREKQTAQTKRAQDELKEKLAALAKTKDSEIQTLKETMSAGSSSDGVCFLSCINQSDLMMTKTICFRRLKTDVA